MGNRTREENWAARERLLAIERMLWWRGFVGRPDLVEFFGLSPAQASADLQRYLELNPGAMAYQVNRKRYEAVAGMVPVMAKPSLEEAVRLFLGGSIVASVEGGEGSDFVAEVVVPMRSVESGVAQAVIRCLLNGWRMRMVYRAVRPSDQKSLKERWLRPTRLVWDGSRWHVRGWCELRMRYADFVMSRIVKVDEIRESEDPLEIDEEWECWETLTLTPNPELGEVGVAALRFDYDLRKKKILKLRVRRALKQYLRERMGVVEGAGERFWVEKE